MKSFKKKRRSLVRKKFSKGNTLLYVAIFIGLLLVGTAIGLFTYIQNQKKQLKSLAEKQSGYFQSIEESYAAIGTVFKTTEQQLKDEPKSTVLGVTSSNPEVLALEDNEAIKTARQLIEQYRSAQKTVADIEYVNTEIDNRTKEALLQKVLASSPTQETREFVAVSKSILTYLEATSQLNIKAVTLAADMFVALNVAIERYGEQSSVEKFEQKLNELKALAKEEEQLPTSGIPEELLANFERTKELTRNGIKQLEDTLGALKNKDYRNVVTTLEDMFISSATESEKSTVQMVSYWQNDVTIRSADTLHEKWKMFAESL